MPFQDLMQTYAYIKADMLRRIALEGKSPHVANILITLPKRGFMLVLIYRIKRYLHLKNNRLCQVVIRLLKYPEFFYCHSELDARANIGPGLVVSDLGGVAVGFYVTIGKNCTFIGKGTPTLGAIEGFDAERDRITLGDYCVFGPNAKIISPIVVADGVQIAANSVLMANVKIPGTVVAGFPAKNIDVVPLEKLKTWSPLLSQHMQACSA